MYRFWEPIVEPLLERLQPEVIIEIGSDHGYNTQNLLEFARRNQSTLHVIDPLPKYNAEEWVVQYPNTLVFHESPSLDILDSIAAPDAVLIDGDHNWHTVFSELKLLEKTAGAHFPVVLFHDVGWPYARRDLYYEPDRIPTPHRHPYHKQGMRPGVEGLEPKGGFNDHLFNAAREGGPRNGVLTAIEDFVEEASFDLDLLVVPGIHDLGVLYESDLASHNALAASFIQDLDSPYLRQVLRRVEDLRIESLIAHADTQRDLNSQVADLTRQLETTKASVQSFREDRDAKAAQVRILRVELKDAEAQLARAESDLMKARVDVARLHTEEERTRGHLASSANQYDTLRSRRSVRLALGLARLASPIFSLIRGRRAQGETAVSGTTEHEKAASADEAAAAYETTLAAKVLARPKTAEEAVAEIDRLYRSYVSDVEPVVFTELTAVVTSASVRVVIRSEENSEVETVPPGLGETGAEAVVTSIAPSWQTIGEELDSWSEDFVVVLDPGDTISEALPRALGNADLENQDRLPVAYVFDHDWLDDRGNRIHPEFKPGFAPDFLLEHDYVSRAVAFRRSALAKTGLLRELARGIPDKFVIRDVLLRLWETGQVIGKIDAVLAHLTPTPRSTHPTSGEGLVYAEGVLSRREADGVVSSLGSGLRIRYNVAEEPLVSIIIPFRDRPSLLETAIDSITRLTTYPQYEIVVVDNQSSEPETWALLDRLKKDPRIRVTEFAAEFNYSRANNQGAREAKGEVLVFLNNDVRLISPGWLEELVGFAGQPGVGAVGALLYYGDGRIQHAGVVVGMQGFAGHLFAGEDPLLVPQTWLRHVRNVSAVTGACLCVSRSAFEEVGGFDEGFQLTGSDVELCLRLLKSGRRNAIIPSVELFHYEKQSRGTRDVPRGDKVRSLEKYQPYLRNGDPYWNHNLLRNTSRLLPRPWKSLVAEEATPPVRPEPSPLRAYDANPEDLERSRAVVASFKENRQVELHTVSWFLPRFDHVYRGGIYTIMRFADFFSRESGTLNRFYVLGGADVEEETMRTSIREAFPEMQWELVEISRPDDASDLPPSDIGVCTLWTTAYALLKYNNCKGKFYFVQDFEPAFFPANSLYGLIEQTYRFGFEGIVSTPGVAHAYRSYGNTAEHFVPGVDRKIFYPSRDKANSPLQIVFYGRPKNPRNGFELGIEALIETKKQYGEEVSILSVGAPFDEAQLGIEGVLENRGVLPNIHAVADLYRKSHIGLVFMFTKHPSYQPLEYMASGCATVTNFNESNLWLLRDGENALLPLPTVSCVTDALARLIENEGLRRRVAHAGLETVAEMSWDDELQRMFRYVTNGSGRNG